MTPATQLAAPRLLARRRLRGGVLLALLLGVLCIGVAGFAELPGVHDGAHDLRHSYAFPCH